MSKESVKGIIMGQLYLMSSVCLLGCVQQNQQLLKKYKKLKYIEMSKPIFCLSSAIFGGLNQYSNYVQVWKKCLGSYVTYLNHQPLIG